MTVKLDYCYCPRCYCVNMEIQQAFGEECLKLLSGADITHDFLPLKTASIYSDIHLHVKRGLIQIASAPLQTHLLDEEVEEEEERGYA